MHSFVELEIIADNKFKTVIELLFKKMLRIELKINALLLWLVLVSAVEILSAVNNCHFIFVVGEQQQNDNEGYYYYNNDAQQQESYYYNDDGANNNDDGSNNDDAQQAYYYINVQFDDDKGYSQSSNDDAITYWTDYAILPKRCIVYDNVDVIVFSVHETYYQQCQDTPIGTYVTPTPIFFSGYLQYFLQIQADKGNDDYQLPAAANYVNCQRLVVQNKEYWLQIGCTDGDSQSVSVNIYTDNTCTTRSVVDGSDDSNIDVSEIQLPFKHCQSCVMWVDKNDDEIDDMFYENRKTNAPLCSTAWNYKQTCGRKCLKTGLEPKVKDGWNTPDKVLLAILAIFGLGMLVVILRNDKKCRTRMRC